MSASASSGRLRFVALAALVIVLIAGAASTATGADDRNAPDLKVAVFSNGVCGVFGDSLPVLITASDVRPGQVVSDLAVCARTETDNGRQLSLRAIELVDVDPACTATESSLDSTCGGSARGELAASLVQRLGVGPCMGGGPAIAPELERLLSGLQDRSVTLRDRLRRGELVCVRLKLVYEPRDLTATIVSQSDRSTWRYLFSVTSGGERGG